MRLSEALRLGSMMNPQSYGELADTRGATCALGAVLTAIGCHVPHNGEPFSLRLVANCADALKPWHPLLTSRALCPVSGESKPVARIIVDLNDSHRWTRDQIATWLETLESPQTDDAVDPVGEKVTVRPRAKEVFHRE